MTLKSLEQITEREIEILRLISEGSSDREIAQALYLSVNTIKWHNRQIYAKLGVSSRGEAVAQATKLGLFEEAESKNTPARVPRNNLPAQLSSFVGREKEIANVKELMETQRLVTITGPGGVGKTRLAIQVAEELLCTDKFPDGIFLIELAAVTTPERVGGAIQSGLGLISQSGVVVDQQLSNFFSEQKILLVLDNYEHVLEAAQLVGELLVAAPELYILATSRESLRLSGEQVYPLAPLSLPGKASGVIQVDSEAIQLFIERAMETKPDLVFSDGDLDMIGEICARLDGLPLAIELAAVRMKIFSIPSLLDQLEDRFRVLKGAPRDAPERHQTMQDAIQWSYDLLDDEEQTLFRRLAVFQGSRSLDAVEEVCCFNLEIDNLEGLDSLLNKNLIRQEEGIDGQPRFYMLETVHEYTREKLKESGEDENVRLRHAEFFVALAELDKELAQNGLEQLNWLKQLKADHDNLRQAYSWSMNRNDGKLALRLVGCLGIFWILMGSFDEGVQWVKECLELVDSVPAEIQADLYRVAGTLFLVCCGEHDLSKEMYHKALVLYTHLENVREMGWSHVGLIGTSEMFPEERELALENLTKSIEYLSAANDQMGIFQAWCNIGCHYSLSGDIKQAREAFEKSLYIARELEDPLRVKGMLNNLGALAHRDGDVHSARKLYKECIEIGREFGLDIFQGADVLIDIAYTELDLERPRRAATLLGAADMIYELGAYRPQIQQYKYMDKIRESIRLAVDERVFNQAWQVGKDMSPEEAIAFALEELPDDS